MPVFNEIQVNLNQLGKVLTTRSNDYIQSKDVVIDQKGFNEWFAHIKNECTKIHCGSVVVMNNEPSMYTIVPLHLLQPEKVASVASTKRKKLFKQILSHLNVL
jgi:hypothetical protein